ncbi:MAG: hypothetical protein FWC73_11755 [Defluviitaleaceae bacterium]|nr:hypothetical protein [Defluviitaleaceae bacterium]
MVNFPSKSVPGYWLCKYITVFICSQTVIIGFASLLFWCRPEEYFMLNELQASFLITLFKNTSIVVAFKLEHVMQFYLMHYLTTIDMLERIIENIISAEVDNGMHHKEIYLICKAKCGIAVELSFLPKLELIA